MAAEESTQPLALCLTAPTASGKTELALEIAARFPVEIISMDSAMVYRGMDIGTAKPTIEQRALVQHHLIDVCDPTESYSAGRFVEDVGALVAAIAARQHMPLIVGGTMMYLRALRSGIAPLPRASQAIREQLDAQAAELGWPALHARLVEVDPISAARIAPADRQRIQRALEVWHATGRPLSALQREHERGAPFALRTIALLPEDRARLRADIERRFAAMLADGLVEEVRLLRARYALHADLPAMRCVGYRQIWSCLEGDCSLSEARTRAVTATRQLAKRQLTWLRSDPGDFTVTGEAQSVRRRVFALIAESCRL